MHFRTIPLPSMVSKTYKGSDIPENLRSLYNYIESGIITDDLTHRIDTTVQTGRYREQWRSEYMKERAMIMDILEETEQAKAETEKAKAETKQAKQETEAANQRADSEAQRADSAEKDKKLLSLKPLARHSLIAASH